MTPQDLARAADIANAARPGSVRQAIRDAAAATGVSVDDLLGRSRLRGITQARHLAMFMARETGAKYQVIARVFGRDHTTIIHGVRAEAARRAVQ